MKASRGSVPSKAESGDNSSDLPLVALKTFRTLSAQHFHSGPIQEDTNSQRQLETR